MNQETQLLSLSELCLILYRRKVVFIAVWILIMVAAGLYLTFAKRTYRLKGTIYVGRLQRFLLEEGEFVAKKLEDYSFIKQALDEHNVTLDIPVSRLTRFVQADVVNEVKKVRDVGIVELSVEFKDRQMCFDIYNALTKKLISDHQVLVDRGHEVFGDMEKSFLAEEKRIRESLGEDQNLIRKGVSQTGQSAEDITAPSSLLLTRNMEDRRQYLKELIKDRHYLLIEGDAATTTFNTKLAAEPVIPDEPFKPKRLTVLIIALFVATVAGLIASLAWHVFITEIKPKF